MEAAGGSSDFVLRIAGFAAAAFIMYALTESRFSRAKTLVVFGGGMALIALGNFAVFALAGWEAFRLLYPLTANVAGLALLFFVARQRPLVVLFTNLTAIQLCALFAVAGSAAAQAVEPTYATLVDLAVRTALAVPVVLALFIRFRPYYMEAARTLRRGWGLLCLMPLAFYAQFYAVLLMERVTDAQRLIVMGLALVIMAAAYGVVFIAFVEHVRRMRLSETERLLGAQVRAFEREVEAVRRADEGVRILRHDLRHHVAEAAALIRGGNEGEALSVLGGIEGEVEAATPRRFCENETVNALLSLYLGRAEAAGIRVEAACDVPLDPPVPALELAGVLANAVENAEHACAGLPAGAERRIGVRCMCEPRLALEVTNTYTGEAAFDARGRPVAREPGHGTGTASIAAFARKHGAHVSYEADDGVFRLRLLGPVRSERASAPDHARPTTQAR